MGFSYKNQPTDTQGILRLCYLEKDVRIFGDDSHSEPFQDTPGVLSGSVRSLSGGRCVCCLHCGERGGRCIFTTGSELKRRGALDTEMKNSV